VDVAAIAKRLDHGVILSERQLRRILKEYVKIYTALI